ncbi:MULTISPECIES: DUF7007 domain-containing protein [Rhizobium]|uniref:DUF7007 domain-containing protein n=2 Tax=Rhizobium TaxID=379 RepID=Q1M9B3_RHIJ3|nr:MULTISPECIES: hypothetical protein [Rhizobium]MBX5160851.1 hypothetical protein [Rhizobium sp. NZLR8]TAW39610.1 hypothetical protein ELI14_37330 [Rhizobium leguminosarum]TBC12943.1 hypothetical protein ELH35_33920 [Rhizobium ruizarguesonis]TBE38579.1 hypothetical protein ELH04_35720 [Rhizobium leguminosarum]CAK02908.1 conserved hypothetical protein [Rhizobium johnstonii 3841]
MNGASFTSATDPVSISSAADGVEFGTSADGFPVARIGEILLGLISNGSGDFFLASAWRITKPLAEVRRHHFYRHDGRVKDEAAFRLRAIETAEHMRELSAFSRIQTRMSASTPWGGSQLATIYAEGIVSHSTSGHGGFHLSPDRNLQVDASVRSAGGWYEEDSEWAIVALTFPDLFTGYERQCANEAARNTFPDYWEKLRGRQLSAGESWLKDSAEFDRVHADDWIVISAIISSHHSGMTEVFAKRGGNREPQREERRFLVPHEEYGRRGRFGFVIDLARHAAYDGPSSFVGWSARAA